MLHIITNYMWARYSCMVLIWMLSSRSSRFQEKGASTSKLDPEGLSGVCETHMKLIKSKLGRGQFFCCTFHGRCLWTVFLCQDCGLGYLTIKLVVVLDTYHGGRCRHMELCTTWGYTLKTKLTPKLGSKWIFVGPRWNKLRTNLEGDKFLLQSIVGVF